MKAEFIEALREGKEYDFIANNYHRMSCDVLADIIKEYIWAVHDTRSKAVQEFVNNSIIENLEY